MHDDENQQNITFIVSHIQLDETSVYKGLTLFQEQPSIHWQEGDRANLTFRTAPYQFGVAHVYIFLQVRSSVLVKSPDTNSFSHTLKNSACDV